MARTQKLFQQLDDLEKEFIQLIAIQFELMARGEYSTYIENRRRDWAHDQSEDVRKIERLENKIISLQEKLGTSYEDSPLNIPNEFISIFSENIDYWGERQHVAKLFKEKLDSGSTTISKGDIPVSNLEKNQAKRPKDILLHQANKNIKAKKDCIFPISLKNIYDYIKSEKIYNSRDELIHVEFKNPKSQDKDNIALFSFEPQYCITTYSIPNTLNSVIVNNAVSKALPEIKQINKNWASQRGNRIEFFNFNIENHELTIWKLDYKYEARGYRSGDKFSNSFKPKLGKTMEKQISSIPLLK